MNKTNHVREYAPHSVNADTVHDRRVRKVIAKLQIQPQLRTGELSEMVGLSISHLERIFKREVAVTIGEYSKMLRLQRASDLLITTNDTEKEIARRVGIPDESNFIRYFKQRFGVTPKTYRNKMG